MLCHCLRIKLTMECPKYSAALSDMYKSFPFCVSIMRNPDKACGCVKKERRINLISLTMTQKLKTSLIFNIGEKFKPDTSESKTKTKIHTILHRKF